MSGLSFRQSANMFLYLIWVGACEGQPYRRWADTCTVAIAAGVPHTGVCKVRKCQAVKQGICQFSNNILNVFSCETPLRNKGPSGQSISGPQNGQKVTKF